jgi:nucleosome binding factor SPN SPT16 subunit
MLSLERWVNAGRRFTCSLADQVDFTSTEWVYSPIIQSGGKYDLRVSAVSDEGNLKPGVILASLGLRYKSYCSAMARTFMINPHRVRGSSNSLGAILTREQDQEKNYSTLLAAREEAIKLLKAGAVVKDVYNAVTAFVQGKSSTLGDAFVKNIGFAVSWARHAEAFG